MNVAGLPYRTIWLKPDEERVVQLIDQRALPHRFVVEEVRTVEQMAAAIREMHVRGAPLIGAAAAYGMYLAMLVEMEANAAATLLRATRPTAVNLAWSIERQLARIATGANAPARIALARETAEAIASASVGRTRESRSEQDDGLGPTAAAGSSLFVRCRRDPGARMRWNANAGVRSGRLSGGVDYRVP